MPIRFRMVSITRVIEPGETEPDETQSSNLHKRYDRAYPSAWLTVLTSTDMVRKEL